ncbi:MAG: amino acid permease [Planctomycetes bacterium]|nr:amino acid permease [Planctomycetota bacterium]
MPHRNEPSRRRFGTFGGVFTPCTLTILGVIMFLRFGQVVGQTGVARALLVVLLAKLITTLTALSLSAIATNTRVRVGGAYYLISRSLGIEFGGAIGIVFFLSQAVSVSMYVIGFTEALLAVFPDLGDSPRLVGTVVNVAVFVCVFIGAGWTIKVQYGILAVLGASIAAFAIGAASDASLANLRANWEPAYAKGSGFLVMFALFFPAATGIMAGANMSGDLRDPGRAIPRGTLAAIAVTGIVYLMFAVLLGAATDRDALLDDPMVVSSLAASSLLITAGVFAATLSSALGSMMGAPRILQALARDKVFRSLGLFGRSSGANQEPRRATALTFVIAQGGVLLGDLDLVAPVITMFFLITYGALNLATFVEAIANNPSYRPTFRYSHWSTSLLGTLGCFGVMFLIDAVWAAATLLAMAAIYSFLVRQDLEATWGDAHGGGMLERSRRNLLRLELERYHPKNWRPSVLALGALKEDRKNLAAFSRWLAGPHGLLVIGQVIVGDPEEFAERQRSHERVLRKLIADQGLEAFPAVTVASSLSAGVNALVQCTGLGALRPNLVLFGWSEDPARRGEVSAAMRAVGRLGRSLAILRVEEDETEAWEAPPGPIDVWWRGQDNGPLMLLLAHILRKNEGWRTHRIRLRRVVKAEAGRADTLAHLAELAARARIPAEPEVFVDDDFRELLSSHSADAAFVILGFVFPEDDTDTAWLDGLDRISSGLPRVLLVRSAGDMSLEA